MHARSINSFDGTRARVDPIHENARARALMMNTPRPRAIDEKWTFCHSLPIEVVGQAKVQLLIGKVVLMFLDRGLWVVISLGISNRLSAWISLP
jgi:hypothetical protein